MSHDRLVLPLPPGLPISEDDGTLTPSLKLKRRQVLRTYEEVVDEIYGGPRKD